MEREKQIQESTKKRIDFLPNVSFGHSFWPFPTRLTARDSLSDTNTTHKTTQAYYARLRLKDQIFVFNQMLEREYHSSRNGDGANDASGGEKTVIGGDQFDTEKNQKKRTSEFTGQSRPKSGQGITHG